jgi:signal transduction histidine kinase
VVANGIGRYRREAEAAVYFCVLEALQNVTKHADASHVQIRLESREADLAFEVTDDGSGFDPNGAHGLGLTNMRDRLEAVGGGLDVRSTSGAGTTVTGQIPIVTGGMRP